MGGAWNPGGQLKRKSNLTMDSGNKNTPKFLMTKDDAARFQAHAARNGGVSNGSFAARARSGAAKNGSNANSGKK